MKTSLGAFDGRSYKLYLRFLLGENPISRTGSAKLALSLFGTGVGSFTNVRDEEFVSGVILEELAIGGKGVLKVEGGSSGLFIGIQMAKNSLNK